MHALPDRIFQTVDAHVFAPAAPAAVQKKNWLSYFFPELSFLNSLK